MQAGNASDQLYRVMHNGRPVYTHNRKLALESARDGMEVVKVIRKDSDHGRRTD